MKFFEKISFRKILASHCETLRDASTNEICVSDLVLFFGLPAIIAIVLSHGFPISAESINTIITAASIFAGLLLNLLVLIYTLIGDFFSSRKVPRVSEAKKILLEHTFANVSFCILVSVALVIMCLVAMLKIELIKCVVEFLVYFLTSLLVLSLLMVLKRIHALVQSEFPVK